MKVYITDKDMIKDYSLPIKIEDSYIIDYVSKDKIEESIVLTAENGNWTISSNYDISISNGVSLISKDIIKDGSIYQIRFSDLDDCIKMYCFSTPVSYFNLSLLNKHQITLGRNNADIQYDIAGIGDPHLTIIQKDNQWILQDINESMTTFINGKRYHQKTLNLGDVIFVNGLKIIWMNSFIKITNPNNLIRTTLETLQNFGILGIKNKYTPVKDTEKSIILYDESQAFFHTPRLKKTIEEKIITIANPPQKKENDEPPAILTLGATVMMGISSSITGVIAIFSITDKDGSIVTAITEILICITMLIGSVLFPILLNKYNKKKIEKDEAKRQKRYTTYLNSKKNEISEELEKERQILYENNLSITELEKNIIEKKMLWNREISDIDFLNIRLGVGDRKSHIKIDARVEEFSLEDDNLKEEVEKIIETPLTLLKVPITVSLIEDKILPLIIEPNFPYKKQLINSIMLQLITYCSGVDLKIVILTSEDHANSWNYLKYLPHLCSKDKNIHFFSENDDEMKQLSNYLETIYNKRLTVFDHTTEDKKKTKDTQENVYKNFDEYYLIITDNFITTKKLGIIEKVINSTINIGFSLLMIESSMQNVPSKCNKFIQINKERGSVSGKDLNNVEQINFNIEYLIQDIEDYTQIIANIPISFMNSGTTLPISINFLEMYKVSKIEQLNIVNRWTNNDPTSSLQSPIGVTEEGKPFYLDLHEKFQGPHGLVAGSTGSGKSELIITFILSMAVNYHPYEVQFVLIDYKGGGLAGAFENRETGIKLPHLAGTITNLDTSEMNRTLVSIKSELKRRQKLFNEARDALGESTVDIYKYQRYYRKGLVSEPISHLFIISDEFAELKSQQPDFMDELISTARIGRSLGVHLILATQKPSGIVDDQIWSNSRFKICLKVQTTEDSNELLKRPEAAYIKETGRFYLQVGYNEVFELGQSAWAGAKYIPTDRILKNIDDRINFINNNGDIIKTITDNIKEKKDIDYGDQLTNIVKTLYNIAIREKIEFKQLWLPSIPKEIYLANLIQKYNYKITQYEICPIIGEYDIPTEQLQKLLTINLTTTGNLIIYGNPGSGKENLLMTMIYSICMNHSPEEINIYIFDLGAETLKLFQNYPQVGDVILSDNMEKIVNEFQMIEKEMNRRKELFSDFGGNYIDYIKNSGKKVPFIITILNGYESFVENKGDYLDYYASLLRDSSKYGITFITTATAINNVSSRISQACPNKIAMQISDPVEYRYSLNAPYGLIPAKYFGRGIIAMEETAYEFQSAYIYIKDQINNIIKILAEQLNKSFTIKAKKIPIIPKNIDIDDMLSYTEEVNNIPIGIDIYDGTILKYDFTTNKILPIIGKNLLTENSFITNLIQLFTSLPNIKICVIDFSDTLNQLDNNVEYHNDEFTTTINNIITKEKELNGKIFYFIVGIGYIYDKVLDEGIKVLSDILLKSNYFTNSYFILIDNYNSYRKIIKEKWYQNNSNNNGIWVGKGVELQNIIKLNSLNKSDVIGDLKGMIYTINQGDYKVIKGLGNSEGEDQY